MDNNKRVELIGVLRHPKGGWDSDDYAVAGAMGCFAEESSGNIHKKHKIEKTPYEVGRDKRKLDWGGTKELIARETLDRGHGAVSDQSEFVFSIDNLTRASTLFLCGPEYASHLQQSLRRATAKKGVFDNEGLLFDGSRGFLEEHAYIKVDRDELQVNKGIGIMFNQFELYGRMQKTGIPTEDARIILPLNTLTTIQTKWDARELTHLASMIADKRTIAPLDVIDTVCQMYDLARSEAPNLIGNSRARMERLSFFPSSQLYYSSNAPLERIANQGEGMKLRGFSRDIDMTSDEIRRAVEERDEALLSCLKHYHYTFSVPMSLMTFHQATRQRTWNQSVEPLRNAVLRGEYEIPDSIKDTSFEKELRKLTERSINHVRENLEYNNVYGVLPHNLVVYDLVHINGWNALHSIGKRTCKTAQKPIREIAKFMAREINRVSPEIGKYSVPQGILYGTCPERENCGACRQK